MLCRRSVGTRRARRVKSAQQRAERLATRETKLTVLDFSEKRKVLAVDDTPENLTVISGVLRSHYTVKVAPSGARALAIASSDDAPDLILLDIMMPEMDGYEVLRRLQAEPSTRGIPVIFVTAKDQEQDEQTGLDLGAVDYITKPISPAILLARVRTHLLLKEARDYLNEEKHFLQREVAGAQLAAIEALIALGEMRDDETPNHVLRMQYFVRVLAESLASNSQFSSTLTDETIDRLFATVPLHDIGKAGLPDRVLFKGDLDESEMRIMRTHPVIARDAIERIRKRVGGDTDYLKAAADIASSHHEKWDGSGYPQGLRSEEIPIAARLVSLADVYDSLSRRRPQSPGTPHDEAVQIILTAKGTHFDPDVVDAFVAVRDQFREIAARYADDDAALEAHSRRYASRVEV